ncbi:MAG: hypothetical protein WAV20_19910, partial [Blastocatellia bacterium]
EVCRKKRGVPIPSKLAVAYHDAMAKLPSLVAAAAERDDWDENFLSCALSAIAASKGFVSVAEAVLELNSEVAEDFLKWHMNL